MECFTRLILTICENRRIKVIGDKSAKFALAINENYAETITLGDEEVPFFNKHNDESLIKSSASQTDYNYGKKINIIRGVIPNNGMFEFNQLFPSTTSKIAAVAADASSTVDVTFTSIDGVRVGDRMYHSGLANTTTITVAALNPGGTANALRLSSSVSLDKGRKVVFRRNKTYSIDIIPDLTSTLGSSIPTIDPEYKLYQYLDPTLTITHVPNTTGSLETKIEKYNDVDTGLAHSVNHTISYTGRANTALNSRDTKIKDKFSVKIRVTCENGAQRITTKKQPVFSNKVRKIHPTIGGSVNPNAVLSNWTNSVAEANGGTVVNITGIRVGAINAVHMDIWYDVEISRWGNKDVNMVFDTTNILTNA